MRRPLLWGGLLVLLFIACSCRPLTQERGLSVAAAIPESSYRLYLLVDAPHLDTSSPGAFFNTLTKHPHNGSKRGDVGHAWIALEGPHGFFWEGGHSGELPEGGPRYFDAVAEAAFQGKPNPIACLWEAREDGYLEIGSGGHRPSYALALPVTREEFADVIAFIEEGYEFSSYSLADHQCCTFVSEVARLVGLELPHRVVMEITPTLCVGGREVGLWTNERYATFIFSSPDVLEEGLKEAANLGKGKPALEYLLAAYPYPEGESWWSSLSHFPGRWHRHRLFIDS